MYYRYVLLAQEGMIIVKASTYPFSSGDGKTHSCKANLYVNQFSFLPVVHWFVTLLCVQSKRRGETREVYLCPVSVLLNV